MFDYATQIKESIKNSSLNGCEKLTWGYARFKALAADNKPLAYGAAVDALPIIYCGAQQLSSYYCDEEEQQLQTLLQGLKMSN